MSGGEIKSRTWTLKIEDDDEVLQTLGRVLSNDLSISVSSYPITDEVGQTFTINLDDGHRALPLNISGNVHTTGNGAWVVLKQAALGSDSHDAVITIELENDDLKLSGDVIVKSLNYSAGLSDVIKFSASLDWNGVPTIDDKVTDPPAVYSCPVITYTPNAAATSPDITIIDTLLNASDACGKRNQIAINSDATWICIGVPIHNVTLSLQGALFFYSRSGTTVTFNSRHVYSDAAANDDFGKAVAMNAAGDRVVAIIDASGGHGDQVVFFERVGSTWSEVQTLAPSITTYSIFGQFARMDGEGNRAAVYTGDSTLNQTIFIFERNTTTGVWSEAKAITVPNSAGAHANRDMCLSRNGQYIAVGEGFDDTDASNGGIGYIYYIDEGGTNNWGLQYTAHAATPSASLKFGTAVFIDCAGNYAYFTRGVDSMGGFRAFSRSGATWSPVADVSMDSTEISGTEFNGTSIHGTSDSSLLIIGARAYSSNSGAAHLVRTTDHLSWSIFDTWRGPTPTSSDEFGHDVIIADSGGYCFVGCPGQDDEGANSGGYYGWSVYT